MNISVERLPNCIANVHVQVPDEVRAEKRATVLAGYARKASLPGFRKGKVPRSVVEKRFREDIDREVTQQLVDEGLREAVAQENLQVLNVAKVEPDGGDSGGFRLEVVLAPGFELPEYRGLQITVPKREVTDDDVETWIESRREQLATLVPVEGRAAAMGDLVTVDYSGTIDGTPIREIVPEAELFIAENSGFLLRLAEDNFVPGFCAQLTGILPGETREVTVTFPEEGVDGDVAGKTGVYTVTAHDIQEMEKPPLDDSLAEKLIPGKTLDGMRELIRDGLSAEAANRTRQETRVAAMEALRARIEFELPEQVVTGTAQRRINELVQMNLDRGVDQETLVEHEQEILQTASDQARMDVKDEFLLMEIVRKENLQVTRRDLEQRVSELALRSKVAPNRFVRELEKRDSQLRNLRQSILLSKALDVLADHAEVEYSGTAPAGDDASPDDEA